jgi:hypothetical protein
MITLAQILPFYVVGGIGTLLYLLGRLIKKILIDKEEEERTWISKKY